LSIWEDLLKKYAEETVNYCTTASSVYLVNEKEQKNLQPDNKLDSVGSELSDYKEKHITDDIAHVTRQASFGRGDLRYIGEYCFTGIW
jgi:hypothetical protein